MGCANPDPSGNVTSHNSVRVNEEVDGVSPPRFNHGDTVFVNDGINIGIIIGYTRQNVYVNDGDAVNTWVYSVMFQNSVISYTEDKLQLVEKFDWNRPSKPGIID